MKAEFIAVLSLMTLASARPLNGKRALALREVPQEHSHEKYLTSVRTSLNLNNPDQIQDPVFSLLGNAAAITGAGKITDPECLQQAVADQAFTNAKAAGNTQGMIDALIFQGLERNTGKVGLASNSCTSIQPVNAEIAAIQRHQDPASANAATVNKASTLAIAQQIQALGGNVTQALDAGTFSPGSTSDSTGKGNSCDDQNDTTGCIFTQNLLVQDFTPDELTAALASAGSGTSAATAASNSTAATTTAAAATTAAATTAAAAATSDAVSECAADTATTTAATAAAVAASSTSTAAAAASTSATTSTTSAALDLGSCTSAPTIKFGAGFDGRTENSFEFTDLTEFSHGSADGIAVLTSFAIQQLTDRCKASASTISTATAAKTSADALSAQGQAAADAWNAAFQ